MAGGEPEILQNHFFFFLPFSSKAGQEQTARTPPALWALTGSRLNQFAHLWVLLGRCLLQEGFAEAAAGLRAPSRV